MLMNDIHTNIMHFHIHKICAVRFYIRTRDSDADSTGRGLGLGLGLDW